MRYLHCTIIFLIRNSHFDLYYLYSNTTFKNCFYYRYTFESVEQLDEMTKQYINWYNYVRPHSTNNYMTPMEFRYRAWFPNKVLPKSLTSTNFYRSFWLFTFKNARKFGRKFLRLLKFNRKMGAPAPTTLPKSSIRQVISLCKCTLLGSGSAQSHSLQ